MSNLAFNLLIIKFNCPVVLPIFGSLQVLMSINHSSNSMPLGDTTE